MTEKIEKPTKTPKTRMHTFVFKEKDINGNHLMLDVDQIIPTFTFGDDHPMLMCILDDHAFFVPYNEMAWFEQNYGVKSDTEIARSIAIENAKKNNNDKIGAEFN